MPPEETLRDVMRQIGIYDASEQTRSPLQTAITAPPIPYRNTPRPRPMPRQMRPVEQRAIDPNAGVREQAANQMRYRSEIEQSLAGRELYEPGANRLADAGQMLLEGTGLPAVRRGANTLTDVARYPSQPNAPMRTLGGLGELGLGALGAATIGEFGGVRPRGRVPVEAPPEPMPRMTPPPREIAPNAPGAANAGPRVERRTIDIPYPEWGRDAGRTFEALQNPTGDQLTRFATQDARGAGWRGPLEGYELRFVRDLDGNVYFVSGYNAEHSATAAGLRARGVNVGEGMRGAGGAGLVTFRDGRWRWSNANGDVLDPIDFQYGRTPSEPPPQRITRPPREIAPNGMHIRPPAPFRQSFVGGSDDLAGAADGQFAQAPGIAPQQAPLRTSPRLFPSPNTPRTRPEAPFGARDMQPRGVFADAPDAGGVKARSAWDQHMADQGFDTPVFHATSTRRADGEVFDKYNVPGWNGSDRFVPAYFVSRGEDLPLPPSMPNGGYSRRELLRRRKMVTVDAGGADYDSIPSPWRSDRLFHNEEIAAQAKKRGFEVVEVRNVRDAGSENATVYMVLDNRALAPGFGRAPNAPDGVAPTPPNAPARGDRP